MPYQPSAPPVVDSNQNEFKSTEAWYPSILEQDTSAQVQQYPSESIPEPIAIQYSYSYPNDARGEVDQGKQGQYYNGQDYNDNNGTNNNDNGNTSDNYDPNPEIDISPDIVENTVSTTVSIPPPPPPPPPF